ncbi:OmpH family outer membrane protein [Brevundimonas sp. Root1279]|uniref:OmpH family outer membrane protein n=1 Tax=Brevundimonas sp. Root1279 TaxID=1736443 RepID=UPI0006FAD388|nr:OmpH family outer membrane protein [Brevundimonas sp. Root1279]KQW83669.1 hypothetical protein ASC65_03165 [Brevundimonas sp. Root1279]
MKLLAIGAFALASLAASAAAAQQAQPAVNHGPAINGVCVYTPSLAFAQSTAGQGMVNRLRELAVEVQGELAPSQTWLQSEYQALQSGGQASDPDGSRGRAWQQRARETQQTEEIRSNELEYTRRVQTNALTDAFRPIVIGLYQEKGCSLLLDGSSVLASNPAMDITQEAVTRMNRQMPALPAFNRMSVPVQQQQ